MKTTKKVKEEEKIQQFKFACTATNSEDILLNVYYAICIEEIKSSYPKCLGNALRRRDKN